MILIIKHHRSNIMFEMNLKREWQIELLGTRSDDTNSNNGEFSYL